MRKEILSVSMSPCKGYFYDLEESTGRTASTGDFIVLVVYTDGTFKNGVYCVCWQSEEDDRIDEIIMPARSVITMEHVKGTAFAYGVDEKKAALMLKEKFKEYDVNFNYKVLELIKEAEG